MRRLVLCSLVFCIPALASFGCSSDGGVSTVAGGPGVVPGSGGVTGGEPAATGGAVAATGGASATGGNSAVDGSELCGTELKPISGGMTGTGHSTRYWDCCMPHCAWPQNTTDTSRVCDENDQPMSVSLDEWGTPNVSSGCQAPQGKPQAYTCNDQNPWAACDDLAFGFAAVPLSGPDLCGKCFELSFDGSNKYQPENPDPGSRQLAGKKMVVMASNTGGDVGTGQLDIMIPGGGLGAFEGGCNVQWGDGSKLPESIYGATFGGMRTKCQEELQPTVGESGHPTAEAMRSCVKSRCDQAFADDADLLEGCYFYVDWMGAADNPTFSYREIECPSVLRARY